MSLVDHAVIIAIADSKHYSQVTYNRAPAMLPALGRPLFARIMDRLYQVGVRKYSLIVGEYEGTVTSYINRKWLRDIESNFIIQYDNFNLMRVLKDIANSNPTPFFLCTYNSFSHPKLPESLRNIAIRAPEALVIGGAMTTLSDAEEHYFAHVEDEQIARITGAQTPNSHYLIDMAVCGHDFIRYLQDQTELQIENRPLAIFADYLNHGGNALLGEAGWTLQIQTDTDLLTLNHHLLVEGQDAHILSEIPYTVKIIPPVRIDPQVSVGQGTRIGPNVYLERGCSVGHGTRLRDTLVLQQVSVPARSIIHDSIVSTRGKVVLHSHG